MERRETQNQEEAKSKQLTVRTNLQNGLNKAKGITTMRSPRSIRDEKEADAGQRGEEAPQTS